MRREERAKKLGIPVGQLPDGRGKNPASHGNSVSGSGHHRWNSNRMTNEDGYVLVRVGLGHPLANPNGYAYEHLVVWCSAGHQRPSEGELLHHKNEDKGDNRYQNLELQTRSNHSKIHNAERGRNAAGQFNKAK